MKIYNFSSGSKGNTTLVKCDNVNILIDVGNTRKYIKQCLDDLDISLSDINMILISHFHNDHFKDAKYLNDFNIYSNRKDDLSLKINEDNIIDGVIIKPFKLSHDEECFGFQIKYHNQVYTHISDTGYLKEEYYPYVEEADYLYLEFNHDPVMLEKTDRPLEVKRRILSSKGHLSNQDAALILSKANSKLKEVMIAHISEEANDKKHIEKEIKEVFKVLDKKIDFDIKYTGYMKVCECGHED
ncbi:MAG: MBL fold metallo-hydrolase [Bacilli bacterium]|jgi:phosphoribosyl 1,2-cyclic phosphodiesterase|nr:MBL fold metallo-hydrolase [Bacilli bacterium]